jgi:hypothetical protein
LSIKAFWDNSDKSIIRYAYEGRWTMDEFNNVYTEARQLLDTVDHPVDFIIDVRSSPLIPDGVLSRGRNVAFAPHPNEGRTIIVGANSFVRAMADIFQKIYGIRGNRVPFLFATTLEEAHAKLAQRKPT